MSDSVADPVLGPHGSVIVAGRLRWASFKTEFPPIRATIEVLTDIFFGDPIPESQRATFLELRTNYHVLLPAICDAFFAEMTRTGTRRSLPARPELPGHLVLEAVDVRGHLAPSKCVLHFSTDLDYFDWCIRLSEQFRTEYCGPKD